MLEFKGPNQVSQADFSTVKAENEILVADMDYSQVGLPRFHVQNEMSQPP